MGVGVLFMSFKLVYCWFFIVCKVYLLFKVLFFGMVSIILYLVKLVDIICN